MSGGVAATAELGPDTTDQCTLVDNRFTLVSLDAFTGDYVEVRLYGKRATSWPANPCTRTSSEAPPPRAIVCPGPDSSAG